MKHKTAHTRRRETETNTVASATFQQKGTSKISTYVCLVENNNHHNCPYLLRLVFHWHAVYDDWLHNNFIIILYFFKIILLQPIRSVSGYIIMDGVLWVVKSDETKLYLEEGADCHHYYYLVVIETHTVFLLLFFFKALSSTICNRTSSSMATIVVVVVWMINEQMISPYGCRHLDRTTGLLLCHRWTTGQTPKFFFGQQQQLLLWWSGSRQGRRRGMQRRRRRLQGCITAGRQQTMTTFDPSTSTGGCKFNHGMEWYFQSHAFLGTGTFLTKIGNQGLQYGNMGHTQDGSGLLFHVNNDGFQTGNQVTVRFTTGESNEYINKWMNNIEGIIIEGIGSW